MHAVLEIGRDGRKVVEGVAVVAAPLERRPDDGHERGAARVRTEVDLERGVQRVGEEAVPLGRADLVGDGPVALYERRVDVAHQVEQVVIRGAGEVLGHAASIGRVR